VPGFEASGANGLVGPAGVPAPVVEKLNAMVVRIVNEPATSRFLVEQGAEPHTTTPSEYAAYLKAEVAKWAKAVKDSGARVD
jgi:tripartite-type tricarboxylate transporter receptor subunit TctC